MVQLSVSTDERLIRKMSVSLHIYDFYMWFCVHGFASCYGRYTTDVDALAWTPGSKYHFAAIFSDPVWPLSRLCSAHHKVEGNLW